MKHICNSLIRRPLESSTVLQPHTFPPPSTLWAVPQHQKPRQHLSMCNTCFVDYMCQMFISRLSSSCPLATVSQLLFIVSWYMLCASRGHIHFNLSLSKIMWKVQFPSPSIFQIDKKLFLQDIILVYPHPFSLLLLHKSQSRLEIRNN